MPVVKSNELVVEPQTMQNWTEILVGEVLICSMLSRFFYISPQKEWLQTLIDEEVFAESPFGSGQSDVDAGFALLQEWSAENAGGLSQAAFDAIETDYMHLFVGPKKIFAPPWESFYRNKDHLLFQKETLQVRNWYRRFGLEVERLYNEPDDHLGIEFSFLAHLAKLALHALESGDQPRFSKLINVQLDFIRTHMSRWVPGWAVDVEANARTPFYMGLAQMACGVLEEIPFVLDLPAQDQLTQ